VRGLGAEWNAPYGLDSLWMWKRSESDAPDGMVGRTPLRRVDEVAVQQDALALELALETRHHRRQDRLHVFIRMLRPDLGQPLGEQPPRFDQVRRAAAIAAATPAIPPPTTTTS